MATNEEIEAARQAMLAKAEELRAATVLDRGIVFTTPEGRAAINRITALRTEFLEAKAHLERLRK